MTFEQARDIWQRIGRKRCPVPQPTTDWHGDYPLPSAIAEMYRLVGPNDLYCFDRLSLKLYLPSLQKLFAIQDSFRNSEWNQNWTVVAHHHGSPFIFDSENNMVTYARAGHGEWRPIAVFSGLPEMLAVVGQIEHYLETPGDDGLCPTVFNEDDEIVPELLPSLIRVASVSIDEHVARTFIADVLS